MTLDTADSPEYEQVYCTRDVVEKSSFSTLNVKYRAGVVVNTIGYTYYGPDSGFAEWVFGGLVTMDTLNSANSLTQGALTLAAGILALSPLL